jgi:hypothetical protein
MPLGGSGAHSGSNLTVPGLASPGRLKDGSSCAPPCSRSCRLTRACSRRAGSVPRSARALGPLRTKRNEGLGGHRPDRQQLVRKSLGRHQHRRIVDEPTYPFTDAKQRAVQNVTGRSQLAELTSARVNTGILARKSSMFLIWFSRRKDRVTRVPGNTTSLLPS